MSAARRTSGTESPGSPARTIHGRLLVATALFAVAVVVHNADHVRRGADAVDADVFVLGTAAIALEMALVVLVAQRHRFAPLAAAAAGLSLAAGYVFVHFLPPRAWFSDPLVGQTGIDTWSVLAAFIEVVAAVGLAVAGLLALSRLGGLQSALTATDQQRSVREALLHPLSVAFALSQVAILAISFAQL